MKPATALRTVVRTLTIQWRNRAALIAAASLVTGVSVSIVVDDTDASAAGKSLCTLAEINSGYCVVNGVINADRVDLVGSGERPGTDPTDGTDNLTTSGLEGGAGDGSGSGSSEWQGDCTIIVHEIRVCIVNPGPLGTGGSEPRSVSDIASFIPNQPTMLLEPAGWTFVGLHTNFAAHASEHIVDGTLWGAAAQVRFTPVRYRWDYGDGAAAWRVVAGKSWAALGVEPWSITDTSRPYRKPGTYTVRLIVDHSAQWRLGAAGEWKPLSGFVGRTAPAHRITVLRGSTVLVESPR